MLVKLRTVYAGAYATGQPGHILDLPAEEAENLISCGYATPVDAAVKVESAVVAQPQTAVAPAQERPRGRKG